MHMIGHQAVAEDGSIPFLRISLEQEKIDRPVITIEEDITPIIASLDNVMKKSRCNSPSYSRHKKSLHHKTFYVKEMGCVPILFSCGSSWGRHK